MKYKFEVAWTFKCFNQNYRQNTAIIMVIPYICLFFTTLFSVKFVDLEWLVYFSLYFSFSTDLYFKVNCFITRARLLFLLLFNFLFVVNLYCNYCRSLRLSSAIKIVLNNSFQIKLFHEIYVYVRYDKIPTNWLRLIKSSVLYLILCTRVISRDII